MNRGCIGAKTVDTVIADQWVFSTQSAAAGMYSLHWHPGTYAAIEDGLEPPVVDRILASRRLNRISSEIKRPRFYSPPAHAPASGQQEIRTRI